MNLVRAEISRFFSRRFIQLMLAAVVIVFGLTIYAVVSGSQQPTEQMWAAAEVTAEQVRRTNAERYQGCLNLQQGPSTRVCDELDPQRVRAEQFLYNVFNFERRIGELLMLLAAVLGCFGFLVMASFVGAEMRSGGMTNLLLWRPNRLAVLGAKFGVGLGLVAAVSALFTGLYVATFYAIAQTTGFIGRTDGDFWERVTWLCVRANVVGWVMGAIAFAIATVGRHTAAALGALIGYVVVWEVGARVIGQSIGAQRGIDQSWFLLTHLYVWLYQPYSEDVLFKMGWAESGAVLGLLAVGAVLGAGVGFGRRDLA